MNNNLKAKENSIKVGYVTLFDAQDIHSHSGLDFYMAKSFQQQSIEVELISSVRNKYSPVAVLLKSKASLYKYLFKQNYLHYREPAIVRSYGHKISKKLSQLDVNLVFSPDSVPVSQLECSQPIVFWVGATFADLVDSYPEFSNLCPESLKNGHDLEQSALNRCKLAIYASKSAAKTAVERYQINPNKVKVVPYGANIESSRTIDDVKDLIKARPSNQCKLLFIGVDWWRKGGDTAFAVAKKLNESGLNTELTIVGCSPIVDQPLPDWVKPLGFISKSTAAGRKKLDQLMAESHFLIVPSRAECFGLVFCEVNSFGVPNLATQVGGIPTIVRDNFNGKLFAPNAEISHYCQYISDLFVNYKEYQQLALSAFEEYQSRLNWNVASKTVKKMMLEIV